MRIILSIAIAALVSVVATPQRSVADEEFSLVIDPFIGATSLRNDSTSPVNLDGYFVTSAGAPILDSTNWSSLEGQAVSGWQETFSPIGDRLGEVNLFDSLSIAAGSDVSIGNAYTPFSASTFGETEPGLSNLDFTYTLAGESQSRIGDVEFSARNTIVLVVDPATGNVSLENQSSFNVNIDGYLVTSTQDVIDPTSWAPLANSDSGWTPSSGATNRIAEGNLFGSTFLAANGGSVALGSPINPAMLNDETDLELSFSVEGVGTISGGVLFTGLPTPGPSDFDDSGSWGQGDLDLVLLNWGTTSPPIPQGWINQEPSGIIGQSFLDQVLLNWGSPAVAASTAMSAATSVPEPSAAMLLLALGGCLAVTRQRCGRNSILSQRS